MVNFFNKIIGAKYKQRGGRIVTVIAVSLTGSGIVSICCADVNGGMYFYDEYMKGRRFHGPEGDEDIIEEVNE